MNKYKNWPIERIESELKLMNAELSSRRAAKHVREAKTKCINNITIRDFVILWGSYGMRDENDKPEYQFSFCIKHDGKLYDIYYECGPSEGTKGLYPWWPIVGEEGEDQFDRNGAFEFIPPGFSEACENSYRYRGSVEEAVKQLKKYGFVNIQRSEFDDDMDVLEAPKGL